MRFKKSFGQNFLRDRNYVQKITDSLLVDGETVIEIGPGSGQVTRKLIDKAKKFYCIEKDVSLIPLLEERFSSSSVTIVNKDILHFDLTFLETRTVIFGNIPFNISNQLIRYLIKNRIYIKKVYILFQKEFAAKLAARCNTKNYGYLSCFLQYYAGVNILFDIPKQAFFPKPRVDTSFTEINFYQKPLYPEESEKHILKLIKAAFSQRRKKIINALECFYAKEILKKSFFNTGLDANCRPENLCLDDYCRLFEAIRGCLKEGSKQV